MSLIPGTIVNPLVYAGVGGPYLPGWNIPGEEWGIKTDGNDHSSAFTTAINQLAAETNGGNIILQPGDYVGGNFQLQSYVGIIGATPFGVAHADTPNGTRIIAPSTGAIITTPSTKVIRATLAGIQFEGLGPSTPLVGVKVQWGLRVSILSCSFNNFADQAIQLCTLGTGNACVLRDVMVDNSLMDTTRLAQNGAVEISGADHYVETCEIGCGFETSCSSASLFCAALACLGNSADHFVTNSVFENADIGCVVNTTGGNPIKFSGARFENNFGHGALISTSVLMNGCLSATNSRQGSALYDEFHVTAGNSHFTGCYAKADLAAYCYNDLQSNSTVQNKYVNCGGSGWVTAKWNTQIFEGAFVDLPKGPFIPFPAATPAPSVANGVCWSTPGTGVAFTNFLNPVSGQPLEILLNTGDSIVNNSTIQTSTNANYGPFAFPVAVRFRLGDGGKWFMFV